VHILSINILKHVYELESFKKKKDKFKDRNMYIDVINFNKIFYFNYYIYNKNI